SSCFPCMNLLRQTLLQFAERRGQHKSFCPSEVARALYPTNWRVHMEAVRQQAQQLADEGKLRITQKGQVVHIQQVKGPIRIQKAQK
ncbi:MAG: DUF3253 domain-containing protein, partial [Bacteroidota bacterium]